MKKYFNYGINYLKVLKGLKTPLNLIHLVTNRCNMQCSHCFYWQKLNQGSEMNLQEIEILVKFLKNKLNLLMLGGGEPFLRDDIKEICNLYIKHNKVKNINIVTNGYLSEKIYETVKDIHGTNLSIQISLDGLEKLHDKIRNKKGSFKKVVETVNLLKTLNVNIGILTVISNKNYKQIDELSDFVRNELKVKHSFELIRGNPKDKNFTLPPLQELDSLYEKIKTIYKKQTKNLHKDYGVNLTALKYSIEMLKKNKKLLNCSAGSIVGTIYPNGDVSLCELKPTFANLSDYTYNFYKLWNSEKANQSREQIKNCFCTHGCFLQPSIVYSHHALKILKC